jgi:2-oxoglutarate/2-oxoacid ferredoxin oxidoreductase subunit alpha
MLNDFVIRIATVNGTGSASTNALFAKSLFRQGQNIGIKNLFPSNIQGLPTWYEIRVSSSKHTSRRGDVDIMVAVNQESFRNDLSELKAGGYFIYDCSKHQDDLRTDVQVLGIPIAKLLKKDFDHVKTRLLLKNMVYVGVLSALLDCDLAVAKTLIQEQFSSKLVEANHLAIHLGYDYAKEHFACESFRYKINPALKQKDLILMEGNEACALGAVYAGATVAAWYPITPSTSLVDYFRHHAEDLRQEGQSAIIQAEDEIAALGMVLGASWCGARSFTATSGPGVSLMSEFMGLSYYAEIPAVIFNVQRCGPSTGMPTRTQQADLLSTAYASHGDTKHPMLFPASIEECFLMSAQAFDLAERLQTTVIVMSDLDLAMNEWQSTPLEWPSDYEHDRGKLHTSSERFYRYDDIDKDGICYRTLPGDPQSYFVRGSGHDRLGRYTEDSKLYIENLDRIKLKFQSALRYLPPAEIQIVDQEKKIGIIFIGTSMGPCLEAIDLFDHPCNTMRIRSFPFGPEVKDFIDEHQSIFVIEQNQDGQLTKLLCAELRPKREMVPLCTYGGFPPTALGILDDLQRLTR